MKYSKIRQGIFALKFHLEERTNNNINYVLVESHLKDRIINF